VPWPARPRLGLSGRNSRLRRDHAGGQSPDRRSERLPTGEGWRLLPGGEGPVQGERAPLIRSGPAEESFTLTPVGRGRPRLTPRASRRNISDVDIPSPESGGTALTPAAFHILLVLASGPAHGYAMMSEVQAMTGGRTRLGPGTLYRSLFKLLGDGWIVEVPGADGRPDDDERRRVYRITPKGLSVAR